MNKFSIREQENLRKIRKYEELLREKERMALPPLLASFYSIANRRQLQEFSQLCARPAGVSP
jgi:hypothetical protein